MECYETDTVQQVSPLSEQNEDHRPRSLRFVVEGGVGAGKSSLMKELENRHPEWEFLPEPIELWRRFHGHDYIEAFAADPFTGCYPFQKVILETHFCQLLREPKAEVQIIDRSAMAAVKVFAPAFRKRRFLSDAQYADLVDTYQRNIRHLEVVDGWINLRATPEICRRRTNQRNFLNFDANNSLAFGEHVYRLYGEMFADADKFREGENLLTLVERGSAVLSIEAKVQMVEKFVERFLKSAVSGA